MGQSRQAVQTIVNILSGSGFIGLQDNPDHKRAKLVLLTHEGEDIYQGMMAIQIPWANQCAHGISAEDLNTMPATIKKLSSLFQRQL